jgi:glucose-6-phosphate 1-dehydrogenase
MAEPIRPDPTLIVIFGAGGDLTWRKLVPALYSLFVDSHMPERIEILGLDRRPMDDAAFRERMRDGVSRFARRAATAGSRWDEFAACLHFVCGDFGGAACHAALDKRIAEAGASWGRTPNRIYYFAVPPDMVGALATELGASGLTGDPAHTRVVVEKPFGSDLASARALNEVLSRVFDESQIYRIDHYLGKETVQNILAFRFANALFEPIWNQRYIDHVQITVAESVGVAHRGGYYEKAGALRDMIQNHLMQVLCLVAMEPPVAFDAGEIRNRKADVLHALRPIPMDRLHEFAARGQYGAGWIEGEKIVGYREEEGVAAHSFTETFAALKLFVDNWRWQGVPFYLRTGKRLPVKATEVCIRFLPAPHRSFPPAAVGDWPPNQLVLQIQPDEGIRLRFQAKRPGLQLRLASADMRFSYRATFEDEPPEAYETLLLDVMLGDATLFKRVDQVEAAWQVVDPILEAWQATAPEDFPNYRAGSWGPESAELLIAQDGRTWTMPTAANEDAARP